MELKSICEPCIDDKIEQFSPKELESKLCYCEPIDNNGLINIVPISRVGYEINDCLKEMLISMTLDKFCGSPPRCNSNRV